MRALSDREKTTIRLGAIVLGIYLVGFGGVKGWRHLEAQRAEYGELRLELARLDNDILRERTKAKKLDRLRERFRIDVGSLDSQTVVHQARDEIQALAKKNRVGLATAREVFGSAGAGELRKIQLGGTGPTLAVAGFVHALRELGVPLVVDQFHLDTQGAKPGQVRFSLDVVVLDFETWKRSREKKRV